MKIKKSHFYYNFRKLNYLNILKPRSTPDTDLRNLGYQTLLNISKLESATLQTPSTKFLIV